MIDLATKIILLLTAIVGLIAATKAIRSTPSKESHDEHHATSQDDGLLTRLIEPFAPALEFAGIYAFVLIPIAFIAAMNWLTGTSTANADKPEPSINIETLVDDTGQFKDRPSYWAWQVARSAPSTSTKTDLLKDVVASAIDSGDLEVALAAASDIASTPSKDEQLQIVAARAFKEGKHQVVVSAIRAISSTSKKNQAAEDFSERLLIPKTNKQPSAGAP